jgi:hypothetical protein
MRYKNILIFHNLKYFFVACVLSIVGCRSQVQRRTVTYMDVLSFDSLSKPMSIGFMVYTGQSSEVQELLSTPKPASSIYSYFPIEKTLFESWKIKNRNSLRNTLLFENDSFNYSQLGKSSDSSLAIALKEHVSLDDMTHYDIIYTFDSTVQLKNKCVVGIRTITLEYFLLKLDSSTISEANSYYYNYARIKRKVGIYQSGTARFAYVPVSVPIRNKRTVIPMRVLSNIKSK